jgi:predicted DNA-binding protein (MmcQ/YjbR family)
MNIEDIREYCLAKKGVSEGFPFDDVTLVFKVMGKMFLLCSLDRDILSFNAKCDPERAVELREAYAAVTPGYHMNKQHWNTIQLDGSLPDTLIAYLIDHSYTLVTESLTRAKRKELEDL